MLVNPFHEKIKCKFLAGFQTETHYNYNDYISLFHGSIQSKLDNCREKNVETRNIYREDSRHVYSREVYMQGKQKFTFRKSSNV